MDKEIMKEKQETTNNNEVYEDIPFQENWKRYDLETIKRDFCNWLDHNIENEYKSHPNLFMKEEEKRLYIHIQEKGYTCLLYTSPSPRDKRQSRMPSSA